MILKLLQQPESSYLAADVVHMKFFLVSKDPLLSDSVIECSEVYMGTLLVYLVICDL